LTCRAERHTLQNVDRLYRPYKEISGKSIPSLRFASATKVVISGDQSVHSATNASTYRTCSWNTFHATGCRRMSASTLRHFRYSRWSPCPARDVSTSDRRWLSADRHNQSLQPAHTATGPVRDLLSISIFSSCRDSVINVLDFHPANMGSCLAVTCIRQWNRIMPKLLRAPENSQFTRRHVQAFISLECKTLIRLHTITTLT